MFLTTCCIHFLTFAIELSTIVFRRMNIYPKSAKIRLFIYGLLGMTCLYNVHVSAYTDEYFVDTEEEEVFAYEEEEGEAVEEEEREEKTAFQEVGELWVEGFWAFCDLMNPFSYALHSIVSIGGGLFFVNLVLLYRAHRENNTLHQFTLKNISTLFFKSFFFGYILQSVYACLEAGVFSQVLRDMLEKKILRRFSVIILYTIFTGVCLLFHPLAAMLIITIGMLLLSWLTTPEEVRQSSYSIAILLFAALAGLFVGLIVYNIEALDAFFFPEELYLFTMYNERSAPDPQELLMTMRNSSVLMVWKDFKGYLFKECNYTGGENDTFYVFLKSQWNLPTTWQVLDFFKDFIGKSKRVATIAEYIMKNMILHVVDIFL